MNRITNNSDHERWVEALDRELKSLPDLRAPPTLAPRVLAAIAARSSCPWYRQSWSAWPVGVRILATVVVLLAAAASVLGWASLVRTPDLFGAAEEVVSDVFYLAGAIVNLVGLVLTAVATSLSRACGPFLIGLAAVLIAMYLCCLGCGTLLYRLARIPTTKGVTR
jgi:predicted lysophospholipase L1 biosynthesis ABC-type transport system permease subunit